MSHLGALITPLVDGELSPTQAAQARAHLAVCDECRRAVALEQTARRRTQDSVRGMQASAELTARLMAMSAGAVPMGPLTAARSRRAPLVVGGGAALVGLFVLTLFVLGTPRASQPPSVLLAATEASNDPSFAALPVSLLAGTDTLEQMGSSGWAIPSGLAVAAIGVLDDGSTQTLDVTVIGPDGEARLLEREGRLDESAFADAPSTVMAGRTVYEVDGWYLLESGTCVVAVHGESEAAAASVIAQLPAAEPDGVLDRIGDGWHVLVG